MSEKSHDVRRLSAFAVLAALCVGIQLAPRPPNVEFTSFFTFIVGLLYGIWVGVVFGGFVMFVNGFLSQWGMAGLNMPFQMVGMAVVGLIGGIYRHWTPQKLKLGFCAETAVIGAVSTVIYDLITNFGVGISTVLAGVDFTFAILTAIATGVFFSVIHVSSNAAVFGILTLPSLKTLNKLVKMKENG